MYLLGLTKKKGKLGELNQNSMIQVGRSDSIIAWGHDEGKLDSTSSNKKKRFDGTLGSVIQPSCQCLVGEGLL